MKMTRGFAALLAVCLLLSMLPMGAMAKNISSGDIGDAVSWELTDGVLTLSGKGMTWSFDNKQNIPWYPSREEITKVVVEEGIDYLGNLIFCDLVNMKEISLPSTLGVIGSYAFSGCESLESFTFPRKMTSIGRYLFYHCTSLKSIKLPDDFRSVPEGMFAGCSALENVELPEKLEYINQSAFANCTSLKEIVIPDTVKSIESAAFSGSGLVRIDLPESLTWVKTTTFSNCTSLVEVTFPNGIERIEGQVFYGCTSLKELVIPGSVEQLDGSIFHNCPNLERIVIEEGVKSISKLNNVPSLKELIIPASVKSIPHNFISYCQNVERVCFLGDAPKIQPGAFNDVFGVSDYKVYYPLGNETWKMVVFEKDIYGGEWIGYDPENHEHEFVSYETSATCVEDGGTLGSCFCGHTEYTQVIPALGHSWGEGAEGERVCTACSAKEVPVDENPFTDVTRGDQFEKAILWAYHNNITKGTSATTFSPEQSCTRKQIVTFLWRAAGSPAPESMENPFTDVTRGDQFEKAILWAYYEGITKGTSATEFSPEKVCTRKQIVTFLWRYNDSPAPAYMANPFTDVTRGDQFEKAILWAYYEGITKGTTITEFSPERSCTRKQIVTFLYRSETGGAQTPAAQNQILKEMEALTDGASLPYTAVLTGKVHQIVTPWLNDARYVTLFVDCEGENGPVRILCYQMIGSGVADAVVGDTITVVGTPVNSAGFLQLSKCILTGAVRGDPEGDGIPNSPVEILKAAYALQPGEQLPYQVTLTGYISSIDDPYTEENGGAIIEIVVAGHGDMPIICHRVVGDVQDLRAMEVVTVTGYLGKMGGFVCFLEGCTCVRGFPAEG